MKWEELKTADPFAASIRRHAPLVRALLLGALLAVSTLHDARADNSPIRVTNYPDSRTISYPLALLEGELDDRDARQIRVVNESSRLRDRSLLGQAYEGRFRALVQLVPGENELTLAAAGHVERFTLEYIPDDNERVVHAHLLVADDDEPHYQTPFLDDPQNYQQKIGIGMMVLQTLTAELMHQHGLGRKTFNLDYDPEQGTVNVRTLQSHWPREQFHDLAHDHPMFDVFDHIYRLVRSEYPDEPAKHMIYLGMTEGPGDHDWHFHNPELLEAVENDGRTSPWYAHTALGGGEVGILGGGDLWAWPNRVSEIQPVMADASDNFGQFMGDYSQSRGTRAPGTIRHMVADNWGASLHELGHTFDRPHEGQNLTSIMYHGYNFDRNLNVHRQTDAGGLERINEQDIPQWAPVTAAHLRYHDWFDADAERAREQRQISIQRDPHDERILISSPAGLRAVHFLEHVNEGEPDAVERYDERFTQDNAPSQLSYTFERIHEKVGSEQFGFVVIDYAGHAKHRTAADLE